MLAYVFWHWPRAGVPGADYAARQRDFHAALAAAPPNGFVRSWSAAVAGAPWAANGGEAFEDWYLVRDSAALDPLNDGAISASRRLPHDAAAALADGGTAGLYRLRLGVPDGEVRVATWFAKPAGTSYARLWAELAPIVDAGGGALWGRQMVLGPTPELCLHTPAPVALPPGYAGHTVALRAAWAELDASAGAGAPAS